MKKPFPGMDPYLEAPSLWSDVHNSLIYAFREQIQTKLNPNYVAVITPYVAFESLQIGPSRRGAIPDVAVLEPVPTGGGTAIAEATLTESTNGISAPLTLPADMTVQTRYARLEIRTVDDEELVTAIEVLSPANKRGGPTKTSGALAYDEKRQEIFETNAHLLEIDLLRNGVRPKFAKPLPDFPYFVYLSRVERRPHIEVWPIALSDILPKVPVPLRRPDKDVVLDIGASLQQIYDSARYERRIDYSINPPPPTLSDEEAIWLHKQLQQANLRQTQDSNGLSAAG